MAKHTARSILDAFYEAERRYTSAPAAERNFEVIAAVLSPDFVMNQTSGLPYAGKYEGATGMKRWMDEMAHYFSDLDLQDQQIFEQQGSDRIMVLSNCVYKIRSTGEETKHPLAQAMTMDLANGTIKELRPFYWDVYDLNKALGFTPS